MEKKKIITINIDKNDTAICLKEFNVTEPIKQWKLLADGPDHPVPYEVIRKIIYVELENKERYIVKFVREPIFTTDIIEKQSAFSDLLMQWGIDTPKRLMKEQHYCIKYIKENLTMDVYVEEWVGNKIPHFTLDLYKKVGNIIGRIHRISQKAEFKIGFSLLFNEITQRDTSFKRLWRNDNFNLIPKTEYERMLDIYNYRLTKIKNIWTELPKAAVQGDIYSCNNIAIRNNNLVVYDFNLAGDEVLVGDILLCWFRTVFDEKIEEDLNRLSLKELWRVFIKEYQKERSLTDIERKYFPDVYAILGTVYYTKLLNFWIDSGNIQKAKENYKYLFELLETETISF